VLIQGYLASIIAESHAHDDNSSSGSSNSQSDGSSDSESSSEDQALGASDAMLHAMGLLYFWRYLADHQPINKSGKNLCPLLTDWKYTQPEIFCAHVCVTLQCFNLLLATLHTDPVLQNDSNLP
jgi:hypothetical protein